MRRLLPPADDDAPVDLDDLYVGGERPQPPGRPWLLANMVSSADGGTSLGGLSGPLGGAADRAVFAAIRAVPDVVLVGAGTVRAERYGPPVLTDERRRRRMAAGRAAVPRLAVVTATLALDVGAPLFTHAADRPLVVTTATADPAALARVEQVADVVVAGTKYVTPAGALDALGALGYATVLCEGGPALLGSFVAADVVDELCLTLAPLLVAGPSLRISPGPPMDVPTRLRLAHVLEDGGALFLRYLRAT